jgi:hypothetical protein
MGKLFATTAVLTLLSASAAVAGGGGSPPVAPTPGGMPFALMLGVAVEFGDGQPDVGVTGKVLVAPLSNALVVGGGVTYLFGSQQFGIDASGGVALNGIVVTGGYDFLTQHPQVAVGAGPTFGGGLVCPAGYTLSGGLCYPPAPSDRRVKRDIVHLATLSDGIKLYSFRYLWSETVHVGVMAQDLLEDAEWARAVVIGEDGFYMVDYDRLDLMMVTLDQWNEHGVDAVVLGARPAKFLEPVAA